MSSLKRIVFSLFAILLLSACGSTPRRDGLVIPCSDGLKNVTTNPEKVSGTNTAKMYFLEREELPYELGPSTNIAFWKKDAWKIISGGDTGKSGVETGDWKIACTFPNADLPKMKEDLPIASAQFQDKADSSGRSKSNSQ